MANHLSWYSLYDVNNSFFFIFPQTKKSFGATKKLHLESPALPKAADSSPTAKQLAASVESFANYLKHIVRPGNEEIDPPPARWSDDEPARSVSRTSLRRLSDEHRLSRERALQAEVENWQLAWKDEKKRKLKAADKYTEIDFVQLVQVKIKIQIFFLICLS